MVKTKAEIIQETYDWYTTDPNGRRGIGIAGACVYLTEGGKMCSLGRCLIAPTLNDGQSAEYLCKRSEEKLNNLLKEEYRGNSIAFWTDLQIFHDSPINWDEKENKITGMGEQNFEDLKRKYGSTLSEKQ